MDHSSLSSAAHERAVRSIPWLVNGTLPADQATTLRAHIAGCAQCRGDYEAEKRLYEAVRGEGPLVFSGEPSFAKLMARIETHDDAIPDDEPEMTAPQATDGEPVAAASNVATLNPAKRPTGRPWHASAAARWLAAAVVIEAALLTAGAWMWPAPQRADEASAAVYQTLTASAPRYGAGPRVRVVFKSTLTLEALQKLLRSVEAHIVDGPTDAQVYTLGFAQPVSSAELDARIGMLRASSQVLFAEIAAQDSNAR